MEKNNKICRFSIEDFKNLEKLHNYAKKITICKIKKINYNKDATSYYNCSQKKLKKLFLNLNNMNH